MMVFIHFLDRYILIFLVILCFITKLRMIVSVKVVRKREYDMFIRILSTSISTGL